MLDRAIQAAVTRRTALIAGLALAGLPALASCGSGPAKGAATRPLAPPTTRATVALDSVSDWPDVVAGIRHFGSTLYRTNAVVTENFTISPFSIAVAFGMIRVGSRGSTGSAIDAAFGFPRGTAASGAVHPALNALTAHLVTNAPVGTEPAPSSTNGLMPAPIVAIANGLFLAQRFAPSVQQDFLQILAQQYGADPVALDFADRSATATINAWVARQTKNRIRTLFDALDANTLLVLANAVYLKADWEFQFDPGATEQGPFHGPSGLVDVALMNQSIRCAYTAGAGWQRVVIPYAGGQLTMRIVVPAQPAATVAALLPAMTAALPPMTSAADDTNVELTLPKWDTASDLDLMSALPKAGLTVPFSAQADFSGIAPGLVISQAVHRANITVDELGTEAAAVTGVSIAASATSRNAVVRADRPFAWAIVHEPTGTPLFAGHVVNPASA
ncbi:MAG: serine (or cysteine) proteinase inhibitor, clade (ovalbumin), er [Frankiales bacterium]|nr:serine (or cysteine) proteinase inhibitor, clade (ovalbumin), er [Frankiales bacterium]